MSSCSATGHPQMDSPPPAAPLACLTSSVVPMACDASRQPPSAAASAAAADAINGQHHLLRHVLSAEQCSDALHHFGTADSKVAARMVNRMSQRELREMFAKVYTVNTNSNNNTWLRRKLLEAVGASRRFYAAANKTGRAKPRRAAPAGEGGHAHGSSKSRAPKHSTAAAPGPVVTLHLLHKQQHAGQHAQHVAVAPGPALPAGSPRALVQRRRGGGSAPHHSRLHYLHGGPSSFAVNQPSHSSEGGGDTCSEGSEAHPRALAPHHYSDSLSGTPVCGTTTGTPTSAFACALAQPPYCWQQPYQSQQYQQYQPQQYHHAPAIPSNGSNSSLESSHYAALPPLQRLRPNSATAACSPCLAGAPVAVSADGKLPHVGSFTTLDALLAAYPEVAPAQQAQQAAQQAQQAAQAQVQQASALALAPQPSQPLATMLLQPGPSCDLLGLWGPADVAMGPADVAGLAPAPTIPLIKTEDQEDWLAGWDDWQVPTLF